MNRNDRLIFIKLLLFGIFLLVIIKYLFVVERVLWEIKEDGVDDGWRRSGSREIESCRGRVLRGRIYW